jgi:hypothetical protein
MQRQNNGSYNIRIHISVCVCVYIYIYIYAVYQHISRQSMCAEAEDIST